METLIFFSLLALICLALLRALWPTHSQIVYVIAEPHQAPDGAGCLPAVLIFIGLIIALRLVAAM
jgi:hypothetical protein